MKYLILWIKASMARTDAYLLANQGKPILASQAICLSYEYERQMSTIRLNKTYGELR